MGSDCSLAHCFQYFLACSPGGTSKFAKNSQATSGFCFCLGNVLFPDLALELPPRSCFVNFHGIGVIGK